jgi:hypothetical protein
VAAIALAGCARSGQAEPPVVLLEPRPGAAAEQAAPGPELCDLVDDAEVAVDPARWHRYLPALEAVAPPGLDLAAIVADLAAGADATPTRLAGLDRIWDLVDERCHPEGLDAQCRNLIMIGLADPLGWGARGADPVEVEAAFDLALTNLDDLAGRTSDPALRAALEVHRRVTAGARDAFAAAGWGPGGLDGLAPVEADMVALGTPEVFEPVAALQSACGFG